MSRRFTARFAESAYDVRAAQALRGQVFRGGQVDEDAYDKECLHVLVEDLQEHRLACAFRIQILESGAEIDRSYAAQFYDLAGLKNFKGKLVEMGRFCIEARYNNPDILRAAWAAMTSYVDANHVEMLFGCSSFKGIKAEAHLEAFAYLRDHHVAPLKYLPKIKAPKVFDFEKIVQKAPRSAQTALPPLLRSYLMMGGWTSDHAVIDEDLGTLHVFTGLEISAVPEGRKRLLRAAV